MRDTHGIDWVELTFSVKLGVVVGLAFDEATRMTDIDLKQVLAENVLDRLHAGGLSPGDVADLIDTWEIIDFTLHGPGLTPPRQIMCGGCGHPHSADYGQYCPTCS